ncbi:hypothetical protein AVEN_22261-1 [Araneus ventricosus]|uniref:Uncharacterized protein n=1 Tax=Araneus ventricosus TaxID=182803 RepID=A0A4Y2RUR6_ARAVE|nr:hypothetical protein AVEN_22261-1 [Araneus ventricosus]
MCCNVVFIPFLCFDRILFLCRFRFRDGDGGGRGTAAGQNLRPPAQPNVCGCRPSPAGEGDGRGGEEESERNERDQKEAAGGGEEAGYGDAAHLQPLGETRRRGKRAVALAVEFNMKDISGSDTSDKPLEDDALTKNTHSMEKY